MEVSMKIEKEIRQQHFSNEHHKLRVNLLFTASWLSNEIKEFLDPFGLTQKQFNILRILKGFKGEIPPSVLDIRERMIDKMSDASRIIDRLEKKGLIRKKPCTMDKRATRILIQESALALLSRIEKHKGQLDGITNGLSDEQAKALNEMLEVLRGE